MWVVTGGLLARMALTFFELKSPYENIYFFFNRINFD
jgi:hypothetical protein